MESKLFPLRVALFEKGIILWSEWSPLEVKIIPLNPILSDEAQFNLLVAYHMCDFLHPIS